MKRILIYTSLLVLGTAVSNAQESKVRKADKAYEKFAFIDAIKTYEAVAEKGYKDAEMFKKLGNSYYFNSEFSQANKWYEELFAMGAVNEPEYYYRFSQTLKSVNNYQKANEMLDQFNKLSGNDQRAKLYEQNKKYLAEIEKNSERYIIENSGINSGQSDYGTTFLGNQLIFSSNRERSTPTKKVHTWTGQSFTALYSSEVDGDGNLLSPNLFNTELDSKFNESTPVFTNDGKTMYFTRNNYNDGKKKKSKERITLLKLYKATLNSSGKYTDVTELPFNSDEYSTAHPALSSDEKTLYFSSDMPGTFGMSDLYQVAINADGTFGTPINLGQKINTEGKETFPFISNDNELYFSSDGHPGLGGLDVFVTKLSDPKSLEIKNVGKPINSSMDDFAFFIDTETQIGFVSSNRSGGLGYDDIYKFKELKKIVCEQSIAGYINDNTSKLPLENVKVTLYDENMKRLKETYTDSKGFYSFENLECNKVYYVRSEKIEYVTKESKVVTNKDTGKTNLDIGLEKVIIPVKVGDDLAKVFDIKVIYFDLDKSIIRPDAARDLEKIVTVMKQNPEMIIDVRSHTDSRASDNYNLLLSNRRAKATINWMVTQGISAERLTGKGLGESELTNHCSNGIKCSEAEHQANRRSEFIIKKL